MYTHIYIMYIYICICMCTCIHAYISIYVCTCIHISVCKDAKIRQYPLAVVGKGVVEPSSSSSSAGPLHGAAPRHLGGPGHAFDGDFLPGKLLSKAIGFERPSGRE